MFRPAAGNAHPSAVVNPVPAALSFRASHPRAHLVFRDESMFLSLLKSKLHMAAVTHTELNYHGSVTIDPDLMEAVGLWPHEKVLVGNCSTGQRGETYVLTGTKGKREIQLNGAMARLAQPGDRVIIMAFASMTPDEAHTHQPVVAILDAQNRVVETLRG